YQNKTDLALERLNDIKQGQVASGDGGKPIVFSNHAILDDVYWLEANMRLQRGEFDHVINLLQQILSEYPDDVLADDAFFLQAEVYERYLKDREKAMEMYREFLTRFAGSVYAAEARKRYRTLRGDFSGEPTIN